MTDIEKLMIASFVKLGSTQQNAAACFQVYMELTEVRRLFDVKYHFDNNLKRIYFTAKNSKSEQDSIFYPISTFETVTFVKMQQIININNNKSFYLAIISPDSTCVYYQITDGLINVTSASHSSKLSRTEQHDNEILLKRDEIEQAVNLNNTIENK